MNTCACTLVRLNDPDTPPLQHDTRTWHRVGPRQLLKFLSESQGQEEDATLLREIEQEEARNAAELAESQA